MVYETWQPKDHEKFKSCISFTDLEYFSDYPSHPEHKSESYYTPWGPARSWWPPLRTYLPPLPSLALNPLWWPLFRTISMPTSSSLKVAALTHHSFFQASPKKSTWCPSTSLSHLIQYHLILRPSMIATHPYVCAQTTTHPYSPSSW